MYIEGYSYDDIQISNVYEGGWFKNPEFGDKDIALIEPAVVHQTKKKSRNKRSHHSSKGEVGRKNGRTNNKKADTSSSGDEPPDSISFNDLFGELVLSSSVSGSATGEAPSDKDDAADESDEAAKHPSRGNIFKAGRIILGRKVLQQCLADLTSDRELLDKEGEEESAPAVRPGTNIHKGGGK